MYSFARNKMKKRVVRIEAKATAIIKLADRIVSDLACSFVQLLQCFWAVILQR